jgi:transcriptional regulator with XRE-family HTH domain
VTINPLALGGDLFMTFKQYRIERGLTPQELADKAGVAVVTIYRCQNGVIPHSPLIRESLARALAVHESELFRR